MTQYNFNEPVNRKGTDSIKYDATKAFLGVDDVIPMWVADTDFKTPPFIINALKRRLEHEVLGYSFKPDRYYQSIINWLQKRHNWNVKKEWISFSPGVVAGFTIAIEQFSNLGDSIIVQPPVYFPFFQSVKRTGRKVTYNPLKYKNGRYYFDFDDLEKKIDANTKMLILCNPHNPGGSVWTKEELLQLNEICNRHNILVVSDEIHADVVYKPAHHTPYASISESAAQNSITVMSHSKTFNVAGLTTSYVVSANKQLLEKYNKALYTPHLHMGNIFGTEALIAAYTEEGEEWLSQLINYLENNIEYTISFFEKNLPSLKTFKPESTFLLWVDCNNTGLNDEELKDFFLNKAKVAVNPGIMFGEEGSGFIRINIGCQRSTLEEALSKIKEAMDNL